MCTHSTATTPHTAELWTESVRSLCLLSSFPSLGRRFCVRGRSVAVVLFSSNSPPPQRTPRKRTSSVQWAKYPHHFIKKHQSHTSSLLSIATEHLLIARRHRWDASASTCGQSDAVAARRQCPLMFHFRSADLEINTIYRECWSGCCSAAFIYHLFAIMARWKKTLKSNLARVKIESTSKSTIQGKTIWRHTNKLPIQCYFLSKGVHRCHRSLTAQKSVNIFCNPPPLPQRRTVLMKT